LQATPKEKEKLRPLGNHEQQYGELPDIARDGKHFLRA